MNKWKILSITFHEKQNKYIIRITHPGGLHNERAGNF